LIFFRLDQYNTLPNYIGILNMNKSYKNVPRGIFKKYFQTISNYFKHLLIDNSVV